MSEYREILFGGWGTASSRERRLHYWQWIGGREFQTLCGDRQTSYRPTEDLSLGRCKACESKNARRHPPDP